MKVFRIELTKLKNLGRNWQKIGLGLFEQLSCIARDKVPSETIVQKTLNLLYDG